MDHYRAWQAPAAFEGVDQYVGVWQFGSQTQDGPGKVLDTNTAQSSNAGLAPDSDLDVNMLSTYGSFEDSWSVEAHDGFCRYSGTSETQNSLPTSGIEGFFASDKSKLLKPTLNESLLAEHQRRTGNPSGLLQDYHEISTSRTQDRQPQSNSQWRECAECLACFESLRSLEDHVRNVSHKGWKCKDCGKSYGRRDTFLRHRATHKDGTHKCTQCESVGKQKAFKRKDHLMEHIRKVHPRGSDAAKLMSFSCEQSNSYGSPKSTALSDARCFDDLLRITEADTVADRSLSESCTSLSHPPSLVSHAEEEKSTPKQQQVMCNIVRLLSDVLGHRHHKLMGSLENLESRLKALSGPKIESVAEGMAELALVKTLLSNETDCSCPKH